jgi:hypothetical protein
MPIENDFLPFAVGSGANVEAQSTWVSDAVLQSGFQSGIANSAQVNKVLRQASIIAAMIAQFIVDNSGQPAIDNGTTATLEANLKTGINALISAFVANALGAGGVIYSPQFASLSTDAFDASGAGQIRLMYGNYGVILRNDGGTLWILLTNSGNPSGLFNSLRPFSINLATGAVSIDGTGVGTTFSGNISAPSAAIANETVSGSLNVGTLAVSTQATAPTPATGNRSTQVATTQCFTNEFSCSIGGLTGYQKLPSGLIIQWGSLGSAQNLGSSGTTFNFPIAFPHSVLALCSNDDGLAGGSSVHLTSVSASSLSQFVGYATNAATGAAAATNLGWIAIGY